MKPFSLYVITFVMSVPLLAAPATKIGVKPSAKSTTKPKAKPASKPAQKPISRLMEKPVPTPEPIPIAEVGPKTWALLVGVSKYQTTQISSLHSPAKDASSLRDALVDPKIGGIPHERVLLLTDENATRTKIMGAVNSFLQPKVQEGDKILVFLAGHGVAKGVGTEAKSYLLPTDVKGLTIPALESSAVSLRALSDALGALPASQFVMFVDACREDPTPGRGVAANGRSDVLSRSATITPSKAGAQSATLFACSMGQRAFEDEKFGHGVFTKFMLDGITTGNVAERPTGAIDLGRLTEVVKTNVSAWAKETTASGNFEIDQTPELVPAKELQEDIVVLHRRSNLSDRLAPAGPARVLVTSDEGAQISINGARAGVSLAQREVADNSELTVTVSKPGFDPVSRNVKALAGYEQRVQIELQPAGTSTGTPTSPTGTYLGVPVGTASTPVLAPANEFYNRALDAQLREQWEVAEQSLVAAIAADAKFAPAYEALYDLHVMQNRNTNALADAQGLFGATPKSAHSLAFLSRAYSQFATKGVGNSSTLRINAVNGYGSPKDLLDPAKTAIRAAKEAVAMNPNAPEAQLALGYALAALDKEGKRKDDSLAAFGKALALDNSDAANQLGMGYGIRFYAAQTKSQEKQKAESNRAISALNQALNLRPNYYEAHRELAFCYMLQENTNAALKECNLARANRGSAGDVNEIASIEVAMSGLYKKVANNSTGEVKAANEAASQGYLEEAQETSNSETLQLALSILNAAGVSTSLSSYLPAKFLPLLDVRGTLNNKINEKVNEVVPSKVRNMPGLPRLPKF